MTRILALSLALIAGFALNAMADTSSSASAEVTDQIKTQLTEQGYEVRKIKTEDGLYEAYAMKDGAKYEIYFDQDLNIVRTKSK